MCTAQRTLPEIAALIICQADTLLRVLVMVSH